MELLGGAAFLVAMFAMLVPAARPLGERVVCEVSRQISKAGGGGGAGCPPPRPRRRRPATPAPTATPAPGESPRTVGGGRFRLPAPESLIQRTAGPLAEPTPAPRRSRTGGRPRVVTPPPAPAPPLEVPSTTTPANAPNCLTGYRWETLYGGVSAPLRGPLGSRVSGGIRWTTINQVDPRTGDPVTLLYPWMWGELGVEASAKTPPAAVRSSGALGAYGNYWWAPELTFRTQAEADEFRRAFTQDRSAALERFRDRVTAHWYAPTVITSAQGRVEGRRGPVGTDVLAAYIEQDYTWALVTYPNSSNFDLYWMPYRDEYINSGGIVAGVQWRWLRDFTLLGASFDGDGQLTGARMIARRAEAGPEGFLGPNVRIGGRVAFDLRSKAYRNGVFNQQTYVARLDDPEIARQFRELLGVSPGADSWRVTRWLRSMLPGWAMPGASR